MCNPGATARGVARDLSTRAIAIDSAVDGARLPLTPKRLLGEARLFSTALADVAWTAITDQTYSSICCELLLIDDREALFNAVENATTRAGVTPRVWEPLALPQTLVKL